MNEDNTCPFCGQTMSTEAYDILGRHYESHTCRNYDCDMWGTTLGKDGWQELVDDAVKAESYRKSVREQKRRRMEYEASMAGAA